MLFGGGNHPTDNKKKEGKFLMYDRRLYFSKVQWANVLSKCASLVHLVSEHEQLTVYTKSFCLKSQGMAHSQVK